MLVAELHHPIQSTERATRLLVDRWSKSIPVLRCFNLLSIRSSLDYFCVPKINLNSSSHQTCGPQGGNIYRHGIACTNLPYIQDYALFLEEFKETGGIWVMKPSGAAEGRGIFLFSKLSAVQAWAKPHLIRRMKRSGLSQIYP